MRLHRVVGPRRAGLERAQHPLKAGLADVLDAALDLEERVLAVLREPLLERSGFASIGVVQQSDAPVPAWPLLCRRFQVHHAVRFAGCARGQTRLQLEPLCRRGVRAVVAGDNTACPIAQSNTCTSHFRLCRFRRRPQANQALIGSISIQAHHIYLHICLAFWQTGLRENEHYVASKTVDDLPVVLGRARLSEQAEAIGRRGADYTFHTLDPEFVIQYWYELLSGYVRQPVVPQLQAP